MTALLAAIAMWLSANFDLPATHDHPKIELIAETEIMFIRYQAFTPERRREVVAALGNASDDKRRATVSIYDDKARTIYLPAGWNGSTPGELSVLVHEMVHHMQNVGDLRYECAGAREKLAYEAQEKWLGLFGRNLAGEFDLDTFTLKVSTSCGF